MSGVWNNSGVRIDSSDNILFTSDAPRDGQAHLHPQLDEYESTPTITGLWRLERPSGTLKILNHTPSGVFSPTIDSFGRIIFTRWDHLQRDQQADGSPGTAQMFASEAAGAAIVPPNITNNEIFPESRLGQTSPTNGPVAGFTFNLFQPWEMNQDGTSELTLNPAWADTSCRSAISGARSHLTRHSPTTAQARSSNTRYVRGDGGLFQIKEDPTLAGRYYAIYSREFGTVSSGNILRFNAAPNLNAEANSAVRPDTGRRSEQFDSRRSSARSTTAQRWHHAGVALKSGQRAAQ